MAGQWDVGTLKGAFHLAVKNLEQEHLSCFIDALDECPEYEVRNIIEFFKNLGHLAAANQIPLHVCFSSRIIRIFQLA